MSTPDPSHFILKVTAGKSKLEFYTEEALLVKSYVSTCRDLCLAKSILIKVRPTFELDFEDHTNFEMG